MQRKTPLPHVWFVINAVLALSPPVYWAVSSYREDVIGIPATLAYFLAICLSISCSILYAYWRDTRNGVFVS